MKAFGRTALAALIAAGLACSARAELKEYPPTMQAAPAPGAIDAMRAAELALGAAIRDRLDGGAGPLDGPASADMPMLRAFYATRDHAPVWIGAAGLQPSGAALLSTLAMLAENGLAPAGPWLAGIAARQAQASDAARAEFDLLLSAALARFAVDPDDVATPGPQTRALEAIADSPEALGLWLPPDAGFWRLRAAFMGYQGIAARGGWTALPQGPKLELGMRDARIALLRQRLLVTGDLGELGVDPDLFDEALQAAVS